MAAGTHSLSRVSDVDGVRQWFPKPQTDEPLKDYSISDSPLAQLLSNTVNQQYRSLSEGARSVGLTQHTLRALITGRQGQYLWGDTWAKP